MDFSGKSKVICWGEMLWDALPAGLFPGGAPMNVAYHLKHLGAESSIASSIGQDVLGDELLRRVQAWGLETDCIASSKKRTGFVQAKIDTAGNATYDILENVAWDEIELSSRLLQQAQEAQAIVFGSLAQRTNNNKKSLIELLGKMSKAMRVFDVNLRKPYDSSDLVWELASQSTVLKLNDEEAMKLLSKKDIPLEEAAKTLAKKTSCPYVCITAAEKGAGLLAEDQWHWEDAHPVKVEDTVGAGDAFTAALTHGLLTMPKKWSLILSKACRLGEWVASCRGATPTYAQQS